jgi:hypothetical protein
MWRVKFFVSKITECEIHIPLPLSTEDSRSVLEDKKRGNQQKSVFEKLLPELLKRKKCPLLNMKR